MAHVHNTFDLIKDPRVCFEPLVAFDADEISSLSLETGEPVSLQECFLKRVDRLAVFLEERLDLCLPASNVNVSFRLSARGIYVPYLAYRIVTKSDMHRPALAHNLPVELAFAFLREQDTQDGLLDARFPSNILFVRMATQHVLLFISIKGVFVRLSHFVECDVCHDPHEALLFHFKHELESTSSLSSRSVLT